MGARSGGGGGGRMGGGRSLPSEHDFYKATGMKFGGNASAYQTALSLLNEMPNNSKIFTGGTVKEAKGMLKTYLKHLGAKVNVGKSDKFFNSTK